MKTIIRKGRTFPALSGEEVVDTAVPCTLCLNSGTVPPMYLMYLADDADHALFCMTLHGYLTDTELIGE